MKRRHNSKAREPVERGALELLMRHYKQDPTLFHSSTTLSNALHRKYGGKKSAYRNEGGNRVVTYSGRGAIRADDVRVIMSVLTVRGLVEEACVATLHGQGGESL